MKHNYSISTNIERDENKELNYILTPNSKDVFDRIISNYNTNRNSFNIIGSYGTGKSSFLWALEKNLKNNQTIFAPLNGQFKGFQKFEFIKFIGENSSFKKKFAQRLGLTDFESDSEIFDELLKLSIKRTKQKKVIVIVVDEFGKFLEYSAKNNPEEELYFIQQLAEFCNDEDKNIMFITTLHQNFSTYAKNLTQEQKSEWEKVRGRIVDLAFDEPVEQLLFFASQRLSKNSSNRIESKKKFNKLFELIQKSKLISTTLNKSLAEKLNPIDYLAAYVLTNALQRYGQNERSLFSFLISEDKFGIVNFKGKHYNVSNVFDYLSRNLSTEITSASNPHKAQWKSVHIALDKAEVMLESDYHNLSQVIKVIALVNIFGKSAGILDANTLEHYLLLSSDIKNPKELIEKLIQKKIIKHYKHRGKLNFLDGTDADIDQELLNAGKNINPNIDVISHLTQYFDFPYIPAKAYQYEYGTPRFFEIKLWDRIDSTSPIGEIDGYINLVLTSDKIQSKLIDYSAKCDEAQIFVLYKDFDRIKNEIFEIQKHDFVIQKLIEDQVAVNILVEEKSKHIDNLNKIVIDNLFNGNSSIQWIWKGKKLIDKNKINSKGKLNKLLTNVCQSVYNESPKVKSELINRENLSTPIKTARKALLKHLLLNINEENLGFPEDKFPPQKTIYLSLLKNTGIHKLNENGEYILGEPSDEKIASLWKIGNKFLESAKSIKQKVSTFYDLLAAPPYKLKKGVAEYWVFIFLIAKQEEFALFHIENGYVPYLSPEILDLVYKSPEKYQIKSYNVAGVNLNLFNKYQEITKLSDNKRSTKETFLSIFRQFTLFYRALPEYSKNTKKLSKMAIGVRESIANAKDPETALFENIPASMGYDSLKLRNGDSELIKTYVKHLDAAIVELRTAYDDLLGRIENKFVSDLKLKTTDFTVYKKQIVKRFNSIKPHLLTQQQKTFHNRLTSLLDDRNSWIKSISDAILNKSIDKLQDDEEALLMDNLKVMFNNLEKLIKLHELKEIHKEDEIVNIDFITAEGQTNDKRIIISKDTNKAARKLEKDIATLLKKHSKEVSLTALYHLLNKK